jgi:hypothetical protein
MTTEQQQDALIRARTGNSMLNYRAILAGFTAKGIPAAGNIHEFKTLKAARASTVGFTNRLRIIAQINKPAAKTPQAAVTTQELTA